MGAYDDLSAIHDHLAGLRADGKRPATIEARGQVLRTYWRLHGRLLRSPTTEIVTWLSNPGWAAETRRAYSGHLDGFYQWANGRGLIAASPMAGMKRPRVPRHLPRPIPRDELDRAMAAADQRMRCWLLLMSLAGLRRAEVAHLHRSDIEPDRLWISGKGGTRATVPLHPCLAGHLTAWPAYDRMWDVTPKTVGRLVSEHLKAIGSAATAHQLRHRFATDLLEVSGDLRVVQEAMRHQSVASTAIYTQVQDRRIKDAISALKAA